MANNVAIVRAFLEMPCRKQAKIAHELGIAERGDDELPEEAMLLAWFSRAVRRRQYAQLLATIEREASNDG